MSSSACRSEMNDVKSKQLMWCKTQSGSLASRQAREWKYFMILSYLHSSVISGKVKRFSDVTFSCAYWKHKIAFCFQTNTHSPHSFLLLLLYCVWVFGVREISKAKEGKFNSVLSYYKLSHQPACFYSLSFSFHPTMSSITYTNNTYRKKLVNSCENTKEISLYCNTLVEWMQTGM